MKIGLLTYHDGINHGAFLQTYSTYTELNKKGFDVQIINYKNYKHWFFEYKVFLYTKRLSLLINNIIKIYKFKKCQKLMKSTKFTFCYKNIPKFDKVIIGSDEVWNYSVFGLDKVYFGKYLKCKDIITYAVSCGNLNYDIQLSDEVIKLINNIKYLSVRDENTLNILKYNIPEKSAIKVLDPTFLHNFDGEEVECRYKNFILLYTAGMSETDAKKIYDYAKGEGKKLIAIGYYNKFCDLNIINIDPFEWLGYFKAADKIITTMFHGTVFSIKYNKQFCVISDPYRTNKLKDLLLELNLDNRVLKPNMSIKEIFTNEINYRIINEKLEGKIRNSKKFLADALKE